MSEQLPEEQSPSIDAPVTRQPDIKNPLETLQQSIDKLGAFGGFNLLEEAIDGTPDLNPEHKARRNIFLNESGKKAERDGLLRTLTQWAEVLEGNKDVATMANDCWQKSEAHHAAVESNLSLAVAESRGIERAYRNVDFFYKNAESSRVTNISFLNTTQEQRRDLDDPAFINAVKEELNKNYDRLDLRQNYSIMVVPGYLGSNAVLEVWAKVAHEHKVMMVTDFEHLDAADDIMEMFELAGLTSGDVFKSNVMMSCNWLVGRGKYAELGEEDDLFVPPSGALAGNIYKTLMSQVAAGKKFGIMNEVDGVRFELKKSEIANLEKLGLVPMVKDYGKVMAFSGKTLFNGDNLGLQTYSVVRVFDYVTKVLIDFLNRVAFQNFNANTRKELMNEIMKFLDSITGPDKLIEDFTIRRFEQDPVKKDKIHLDIHMKPYFPAKNFMIRMEGQKGDDGNAWNTGYEQDK